MVKINCIVCEQPIKFPSYVDADDYDGQIFCHKCNRLLYVRLKSSKVKKYEVIKKLKPERTDVKFTIGKGYNEKEDGS